MEKFNELLSEMIELSGINEVEDDDIEKELDDTEEPEDETPEEEPEDETPEKEPVEDEDFFSSEVKSGTLKVSFLNNNTRMKLVYRGKPKYFNTPEKFRAAGTEVRKACKSILKTVLEYIGNEDAK